VGKACLEGMIFMDRGNWKGDSEVRTEVGRGVRRKSTPWRVGVLADPNVDTNIIQLRMSNKWKKKKRVTLRGA